MPQFAGLSHVSLSVRNRDVSRDWYRRVLGFEQLEEARTDAYDEWILLHPGNHMGVVPATAQGEPGRGIRSGSHGR
jgi:catechol 2,3-dioxygenase-like lactoylglutathione lyase family enzyme